ncbi:TonB-dependent receptor [Algoriphagus lutimaris]|uniref:TonB-dependent receptor domain-containing protein n=1 Tax=Algoriphagus lutimaris TaxID=613197 RepID=UPI00196B1565|nr:TonB-dependent receptor [Algoriphagus lutimaris]MBN3518805.1 TonB-dependent receptor [Algoriphagus lutimaris]
MKLKVFNTILVGLFPMLLAAQSKLSGTIKSSENNQTISSCIIYLNDGSRLVEASSKGEFYFGDLANGSYTVHFTSEFFEYKKIQVSISNSDQNLAVFLDPKSMNLEEAVVTESASDFGLSRMNAVDNMGLYEAKKSEVILPENMTANLSTNNARQVYSKVVGLNIWENDGAGLQLSIGGRGLDPNRSSNFNTRQNGYDISADALGYPESYYTPPLEGIGKIQIVRGAASLQYGTQFGGLVNFQMKRPVEHKKIELTARQTLGSFGFYNAFTSLSGTNKKFSYYTFFQYKKGNGWRPNSEFNSYNFYTNLNYQVTENTKVGIDITKMTYLSQQPGGLTDEMFEQDPRQSNRSRNWFNVDWNLYAFHLDHKFNQSNSINLRFFGLNANRYSIGFRPNRVATIDDNSERDLIKGDFENWGTEFRYLKRYSLGNIQSIGITGIRYYHGYNHSTQGFGSTGSDANFNYLPGENNLLNDYEFPNKNISLFWENIFFLNDKFSITPGVRFENIRTSAEGYYAILYKDLAGNIIERTVVEESRKNNRSFILGGLGLSFKPNEKLEVYSNISQNYRSITFSDMRISNPSATIDPDLEDEKGYSIDLGIRSDQNRLINYDLSLFYLNYNNRIGEVQYYDESNRVLRQRTNIGQAIISGFESYVEWDFMHSLFPENASWKGTVFSNLAIINSTYRASDINGIEGNEVEFVPNVNFKTGLSVAYNNFKSSLQFSHLSDQFSDATNAIDGGVSAVVGLIPAYSIMDFSLSYEYKKFKFEGSVNNLTNAIYFTRRATGYPGPGILPSDGRGIYLTVQFQL